MSRQRILAKPVVWVIAVVLVAGPVAHADDWPQFRGPGRDGISKETGWLARWPDSGLKTLWKHQVGRGYSCVAVSAGRVYTLGLLPQAGADPKGPVQETVSCLEESSGKTLWRFGIPGTVEKAFPGSRSTPTIEGDRAFVYGQAGGLYCLETATGKVVWQKSMMRDLGAQKVVYGYAASPLIVGELVLAPARIIANMPPKDSPVKPRENALLLAFNKKTGDEVWRTYHESFHLGGGYYACPTACVIGGKPCLAYHTGNACLGLDPATGKILWKHAFSDDDLKRAAGRHGITAQEPVVLGNRVLCCIHPDNSNGLGVCLEVEGDRVREVWRDILLDNYTCSYILWKGHVFGITHNDTASRVGPMYCFDVMSGRKKWEQKDAGGSMILVDGKFLTFTGNRLVLIEASTEGYKELARSRELFLPGENTARDSDRINPVLSNGRIYCRSQTGMLLCLDASGGQ